MTRFRKLLFALCAPVMVFAAQEDVRKPKEPVGLGTVTLSDGRVLNKAAVVSDTAYTITIRHGEEEVAVEVFDKKLLPESKLGTRWRINETRAKVEERERIAAESFSKSQAKVAEANKRNAIATAKSEADAQARREAGRANGGVKKDGPSPQEIAMRKEQLRREQQERDLAISRDGLLLTRFGMDDFRSAHRALGVVVKNANDNPRRLEWRQLRALAVDGAIEEPLDVVFELKEVASYDVDGRETRRFVVTFPAGRNYVAVSWSDRPDLGWRDHQGNLVDPEDARAAGLERIIAARKADRASKLIAVEGQKVPGSE